MTKAQFTKRVATRADLTNADAARAVQAFIDEVQDSLKSGQPVQFAGFGKFSVSDRAARTGVNPRDPGTRIEIPARKVPKFTAGAVLKASVAGPPPKKAAPKKAAKKSGRKK
jgi:DNA-binding protein HU-beta